MAALEKNDPPNGGVKWRFPSVHPEGRKFALIAAGITGIMAILGWDILGWLMVGVTVWVLAFFRDPIRTIPRAYRILEHLYTRPAVSYLMSIRRVEEA